MEILKCPFADCGEQVRNVDKDIPIALHKAHISTYTDRSQGSKPSKVESIPRPRTTQGMPVE